jgi:hypothetical protein
MKTYALFSCEMYRYKPKGTQVARLVARPFQIRSNQEVLYCKLGTRGRPLRSSTQPAPEDGANVFCTLVESRLLLLEREAGRGQRRIAGHD